MPATRRQPHAGRAGDWPDRAPLRWRVRLWQTGDFTEIQFRVLVGWIVLVFLMGGGARGDIHSLAILRPVAAIMLVYGLATLTRQQVGANRLALGFAAALVLLAGLQLVPLPPTLWPSLPGRRLIVELDRLAELGAVWRPLSLSPASTRNALWSLLVPVSVLVLAIQLDRRRLHALMPVICVIAGVSGLLGMLQMVSDARGMFYFYDVTHNGMGVGLFANRNHQGLLLAMLFHMAMAWIRSSQLVNALPQPWKQRADGVVVLGLLALILPLVLVTGSRLGMIAAAIALLASPLLFMGLRSEPIYRSTIPGRWPLWLAIGAGLAALLLLTSSLGRAIAFDRLLGTDPTVEMRFRILPTLFTMIREFWPWGSGFGSFAIVYQIYEPDALLNPTYMNQAHNDWLDVPLTGGLPAVTLLAIAVVSLLVAARRSISVHRSGIEAAMMARIGLLTLAVLGLGSVTDYPLRVPSLAGLAVIAALWVTAPLSTASRSARHD